MQYSKTKALAISALLIALAVVLNQITLFRLPQGGSITALSMVPIALCAYMLGTRWGFLAGCCAGLLSMIFHPYIIHPVQMLLDYPLAFGALGLGGFMKDRKYGIIWCYLIGVFGRYICSVLSGAIFFGSYAPEGFNAWMWSIYYNACYIGIECAISTAVLCIPQIRHIFDRLKNEISHQ